jgi:SAM-dependent methyltransferase
MNPGSEYFDASEFSVRGAIEDSHYWHLHRRCVLLETLRAFAPPESTHRLLEIGCGIGTVTTHLNANGYRVDYGDFFEDAIAIAKQRAMQKLGSTVANERRFLRIDATQRIDLAGYDGILLLDVIEHLPDDELVLSNVRRVLDKGGFVMVTVPAFDFLWSPWDDVEKHKRRYTQAQLGHVLDRAGFRVEHSTYVFAPLFFAALGVKTLRKLREVISPPRRATNITELSESKNIALLNRLMMGIHAPERRWLSSRRGLPLGTSVLSIARAK